MVLGWFQFNSNIIGFKCYIFNPPKHQFTQYTENKYFIFYCFIIMFNSSFIWMGAMATYIQIVQ